MFNPKQHNFVYLVSYLSLYEYDNLKSGTLANNLRNIVIVYTRTRTLI